MSEKVPEMLKLGVLYSGRILYGCTINGEYAYAATDQANPKWEELTWWSRNTEWVTDWLEQVNRQSREARL